MKTIALILATLLIFSCQKKLVSERASWKLGDDNKNLKLIENQEWSERRSELELKNEKIVITQQSLLGIPIEKSFLKKTYKKIKGNYILVNAEALITTPPALRMVAGLSFNENEILKKLQGLKNNFFIGFGGNDNVRIGQRRL